MKKKHEALIELFIARIQRYNAQKPMKKYYTKHVTRFFRARWDLGYVEVEKSEFFKQLKPRL